MKLKKKHLQIQKMTSLLIVALNVSELSDSSRDRAINCAKTIIYFNTYITPTDYI